jgi:PAS domain S-box-containing protein
MSSAADPSSVSDQRVGLQSRESGLLRLFGLLPNAVIVRDADDVILFWNDASTKLYGWTASEAVGKRSAVLLFTRLPVPQSAYDDEMRREGCWSGAVNRLRRDGQRLDVPYRAVVIAPAESSDGFHVEITGDPLPAAEVPVVPKRKGPRIASLLEKLRGLKAANAAVTKENKTLRAASDRALEQERHRRTLVDHENARLRELLMTFCAIALSFPISEESGDSADGEVK